MLWLLLVVPPALVAFFWWSWRKKKELLTAFIQARLLPNLLAGLSPAREKARAGMLVLGVSCLLFALARPQWGFSWEEVKQRGLDIVVAIDTSKSMLAQDLAPNRLARAKLAALDLMQLAKSDRLGLVAFAGNAFLQCPLTIDDSAFRQSVEGLDVNTMSRGGTAIGEAITTAAAAFKEQDNYKVIVLLTDGEDHDSGAAEAGAKAAQAGVQIFTIGVGTPEGELLQIKQPNGTTDYVRDEKGNVIKSHLDEDLLRKIAGATERGFYLPLRGAKAMDILYEKGLAPLPKSEGKEKLVKRYHERFHWPLGLGILLLALEILYPSRKSEARLKEPAAATRKLAQTALVLVLATAAGPAFGSSSSALRDYKSGEYEKALREYNQLLQKKSDDPRLQFNAGTAAYQSRDYEQAIKRFKEALAATDLKLQELAYYNRGNSLYQLGQRAMDPKQKTQAWENSLKDFESSLKLNPNDADAKHNQEFVKRQLEELKKQQQQQQSQSDQNKEQNKDQNKDQQQNQQQKQDQNKDQQQPQQDQQKQEQAQQNQRDQQKQGQQQQQQQAQKQEQEKQQASQKEEKPQEQQTNQAQAKPEQSPEQPEETNGVASAAGQMTPQEARQLLDSQKEDEKVLQLKPEEKPRDQNRPVKDW